MTAPTITLRTVNRGPLGRGWRAICDACAITLPGIHSDRHDAHAAGDAHLADKHGRRV